MSEYDPNEIDQLVREVKERQSADLNRRGGSWLAKARSWIQRHCRNGERVTWGSNDILQHEFTVYDVEDIALEVAKAVYAESAALADHLAAAKAEVDRLRFYETTSAADAIRELHETRAYRDRLAAEVERLTRERDDVRKQLDGRIEWQVSAVAHLRTWSGLFDAAVAMREGHEGCVTEPACGDCFRCRFDAAVDEAMKAVSANSPGSLIPEDRLLNCFLCPDCGLGVGVDDDGCCATCGLDCFGFENGRSAALLRHVEEFERVAEKANAARADRDRLRAENDALRAEVERMREALDAARNAARALVAHVDNLGALADDNDPRAMALAAPIGATQADLYAALGLDLDEETSRLRADIDDRCAVCGWTLATSAEAGCVRGNCSMRPRPERLYAPERAVREALAAEKEDGRG